MGNKAIKQVQAVFKTLEFFDTELLRDSANLDLMDIEIKLSKEVLQAKKQITKLYLKEKDSKNERISNQLTRKRETLNDFILTLSESKGIKIKYDIEPELYNWAITSEEMIQVAKIQLKYCDDLINFIGTLSKPSQNEVAQIQESIEIRPNFIPESIDPLFQILKNYFNEDEHEKLNNILRTGDNLNKKLFFKGTASQFGHTFKILFGGKHIISCDKKNLREWIIANFMFKKRGKASNFTDNTLEKYISSGKDTLGEYFNNPIIEINNGQIVKSLKS
jgi:hypothetical protein